MPRFLKRGSGQPEKKPPTLSAKADRIISRIVGASGTASRNLTFGGVRTSIRVDSLTWDVLCAIADHEGVRPDELAARLAAVSAGGMALTAAMRIFALNYLVSCIADLPPSADGLLSGLHAELSALAEGTTVPAASTP